MSRYNCTHCGDPVEHAAPEGHRCWAWEKMQTQETLPPPDVTAPPVSLVDPITWPER